MRPEIVRAALLVPGLKPSTSRLLAYMADVAMYGLFFERRERTAHMLGLNPDTIKAALAELIAAGHITEEAPAVGGKRTRTLRLHPDRWPQPVPPPGSRPPDQPNPPKPTRRRAPPARGRGQG